MTKNGEESLSTPSYVQSESVSDEVIVVQPE